MHSTPADPEDWNYVLSELEANKNFPEMNEKICFIGHSHLPAVFTQNEGKIEVQQLTLNLLINKYIINVGSVGQPRDGNPKSCLVIYDTETNVMGYHRVEYPIIETYNAIIENNLPKYLAMRLLAGH